MSGIIRVSTRGFLSDKRIRYNVLVMILASVVLTYSSLLHYRNKSYCNVINQRKCGELLIPEKFISFLYFLSLNENIEYFLTGTIPRPHNHITFQHILV